jgi:cytochrome c oxidase subunit 3
LSWLWACFALDADQAARDQLLGGAWPKSAGTVWSWQLPLIATLILLASTAAVTSSHQALLRDDRAGLRLGLGCTILLGLGFIGVQVYAYGQAPFAVPADLCGAMLFMWTGYHGALVMVGLVVLLACLILAGRFSAKRPFGFELAAWSWHVVDAAWLLLFAGAALLAARASAGP